VGVPPSFLSVSHIIQVVDSGDFEGQIFVAPCRSGAIIGPAASWQIQYLAVVNSNH
jgi:hypothetical protein